MLNEVVAPSLERGRAVPKVLHFVTGGFSGATQVALDLVQAHQRSGRFEPLLVLRRKRQTDPARIEALRTQGVPVQVVAGWSHWATVRQLAAICRQFRPDILVAHGFSDHLWGRYAGLRAGVPHLVHVEHNSRERYTPRRLRQALWLSERTDRIVGCSEGVAQSLLALGFPAGKVVSIPNGIRLEPFEQADQSPLAQRQPGIVMAARFARQKDHATLLQSLALLRQRGLRPQLHLAGGGKARMRKAAEQLARRLDVQEQVHFLGHCPDVPGLLMAQQLCVLSSHYEGMPLSLIEGMAAGCAVVGSRVAGIQEVIAHGRNGLLVEPGDAASLADALQDLLTDPAHAAALAGQARRDAMDHYGLATMTANYEALFASLLTDSHQA
ncbi:glycosyltransferase [Corticibacter populi]|uniref:Glycosyltransferase n=1 Tax=Corticibacter populi TaxID=1550736 RepID=A0A3M6QMB3_9BURK|nr:glycosyltransferase [Corticibacter populi]RMX04186.1 glycosyltransferase [Corticibacter populi]RZS33208.1 glycosyltransferase involved in cell wall biosynthesis [Corticibacter populi]